MQMTKLELTKKIVGKVAVLGSGIVTNAVIRNNLPADLKLYQKAAVLVATFVIGGIVGDAVEAQSDKLFDSIVEVYDNIQDKLAE